MSQAKCANCRFARSHTVSMPIYGGDPQSGFPDIIRFRELTEYRCCLTPPGRAEKQFPRVAADDWCAEHRSDLYEQRLITGMPRAGLEARSE